MEDFGVLNYFTYVVGTILVILLPGPNSLYVLSLAAQQGAGRGWAATVGILVGDGILILLAAVGAVSLLTNYPALFVLVKLVGALYLAYLGTRLIYRAWHSFRQQADAMDNVLALKPISIKHAFSKALFISLLNPKGILFFLSFFVQFIDPEYPSASTPFLILALTCQFFSFCYLASLIYAGTKLARMFNQHYRVKALSASGVGLGFVGFALKLALVSAAA